MVVGEAQHVPLLVVTDVRVVTVGGMTVLTSRPETLYSWSPLVRTTPSLVTAQLVEAVQ